MLPLPRVPAAGRSSRPLLGRAAWQTERASQPREVPALSAAHEYAGVLFAPDAALAAHPAEETHWQKLAHVPEGAVRIAKPDLDSSFMDRSDSVRGRVLHYSTRKTHVLATEILYLTGIPDKSQFCSAMGATISFDHLLRWS